MRAPDAAAASAELEAARAELVTVFVATALRDHGATCRYVLEPLVGPPRPPPDESYMFWAADQMEPSEDQVRRRRGHGTVRGRGFLQGFGMRMGLQGAGCVCPCTS
jgi:hypothetical protein